MDWNYKKIGQLRNEKGLTQQELADKIGVHRTHLAKVEGGHVPGGVAFYKKLAHYFNIQLKDFF
jgi:transcriptional regulator with XRE-family HTH domain